jgi:hypothetical protein
LIFSDVVFSPRLPWQVGLYSLIFWLGSRLVSCCILVLRAFPADTSLDGCRVLWTLVQWIGLPALYTLFHIHTWYCRSPMHFSTKSYLTGLSTWEIVLVGTWNIFILGKFNTKAAHNSRRLRFLCYLRNGLSCIYYSGRTGCLAVNSDVTPTVLMCKRKYMK